MKKVAILGSTGSIGTSALKVVRGLPGDLKVTALAAHSNIDLLEAQAREFHPEVVAVADEAKARELSKRLSGVRVLGGRKGLEEAAAGNSADIVLTAITGTAALEPTVAAIRAEKDVALASKEVLVSAGALVMGLVKQYAVNFIPVDSEHSAIFQCLNGEKTWNVRRLILTSSGGPFRQMEFQALQKVTVEQALAHPTWAMGPKVTVDSSTLMNKGLEVIEAYWLFGLPLEKIQVVVHPQSIIHSMVEFQDTSILAQMGRPDMMVPIQYALTYPERRESPMESMDFTQSLSLSFEPPRTDVFRCLGLAYEAVKVGGSLPCYMNAANEVLVQRFLNKQIAWQDIPGKLETLMSRHQVEEAETLEDVLASDSLGRMDADGA